MAPPTLVTLPYDIKLEILKELLCAHRPIRAHGWEDWGDYWIGAHKRKENGLHTAILYTCKALHDDGIYALYHFNKIVVSQIIPNRTGPIWLKVPPMVFPSQWFSRIGALNAGHLRTLRLSLQFQHIRRQTYFPYWSKKVQGERLQLRAQSESDLAETCKQSALLLGGLARSAHSLRNLHISLDANEDMQGSDLRSITQHLVLLRVIREFQHIDVLTLYEYIPRYWILYLNRRLGARVKIRGNVHLSALTKVILDQRMSISESRALAGHAGAEDDSELRSLDDQWEEDIEGFSSSINWKASEWVWLPLDSDHASEDQTCDIRPFEVLDEPQKYAVDHTRAAQPDFSGLDLLAADVDLFSGKYWPPIRFHERELEIEESKLAFLMESFKELKDLGIMKKKGDALPTAASERTMA